MDRTGLFADFESEEERRKREQAEAIPSTPTPEPTPEPTSKVTSPSKSRTGLFDDFPAATPKSRTGLFDDFSKETPKPQGELDNSVLGIAGRHLQAAAQGVADPLAGLFTGAELALEPIQAALGIKGESQDRNKMGFQIAQGIRDLAGVIGKPDERDQSMSVQVARGIGQLASQVGLAVIPGIGFGLSTASALGSGGTEMYEDAIAHGADHDTALKAAGIGVIISAPELIVARGLANKLAGKASNEVKTKITREILKTFVMEGGTEAAQQAGQNVGAIGLGYDKDRNWFENVGTAAFVGGFTGGIGGAVVHALTSGRTATPDTTLVEETAPSTPTLEEKVALSGATGAAPAAPSTTATPEELVTSGAVAPDVALAVAATKDKGVLAEKTKADRLRDLLNATRGSAPELAPPSPAGPLTEAAGAAPVPEAIAPPAMPVPGVPLPGAETALDETVPMPPPGATLPQEVTAAPETPVETPVETSVETPMSVDPDIDDTMSIDDVPVADQHPTVPETPDTLDAQYDELVGGQRMAMLHPEGGDLTPKPPGAQFTRTYIPKVGLIDYNNQLISGPVLRWKIRNGQLGEVLGLGPVNKAQVAESVAAGSPPVAVVRRNAEGTPVATAAGTEATAPEQVAAIEASAQPGDTVNIEPAETVLEERLGAPAPAPVLAVPSPVPAPPASPSVGLEEQETPASTPPTPSTPPKKPVQALSLVKLGVPQPTPKRPLATPPAVKGTPSTPRVAPTPAAEEDVTYLPVEVSPERQAEIDAAEEALLADVAARKKPALKTFKKEVKAEAKPEKVAEIQQKSKGGGYSNIGEEAVDRLGLGAGLAVWLRKIVVGRALHLQDAFDKYAPQRDTAIDTQAAANTYGNELRDAVDKAEVQLEQLQPAPDELAELSKDNRVKLDRYSRIPSDDSRVGFDTNTDHVVWFAEANRIARLIERGQEGGHRLNEKDMQQVNDFIADTKALKQGDGVPLRERRRFEGDAGTFKGAGNADVNQIAAEPAIGIEAGVQDTSEEAPQTRARASAKAAPRMEGSENKPGSAVKVLTLEEKQRLADEIMARYGAAVKSKGKRQQPLVELSPAEWAELRTAMIAAADRKGIDLGTPGLSPEEILTDNPIERSGKVANKIAHLLPQQPGKHRYLGQSLADRSLNEFRAMVGRHILGEVTRVAPETKVVYLDDATYDMLPERNSTGFYRPGSDTIVMRQSVAADPRAHLDLFVHEAGHAVTHHAIEADPKSKAALDGLIRIAKDAGIDPETYGFTDAHEFMSEVWSNPDFAQQLADVQVPVGWYLKHGVTPPKSPVKRNLLEAFRALIDKIFGVQKAGTVLREALRIGELLTEQSVTARQNYYSSANPPNMNVHYGPDEAKSEEALKREAADVPKTLADRLTASGIPEDWADEFAALIDAEFGGELSDAELAMIAGEFSKPILEDADIAKRVEVAPARMKPEIAKLASDDVGKASPKMTAFALATMPLNIMTRKYGKLFTDNKGVNFMKRYLIAQQKRDGIANRHAEVYEKNSQLLREYANKDKKAALELADLAMTATGYDVRLAAGGGDNSHLGVDKKRYLQSKKELPKLQARYDAMPKEAQKLYDKLVKDYRNAHNEGNQLIVTRTVDGLGLPLSASDRSDLVNKILAGTLTPDDAKTYGLGDAFDGLRDKTLQSMKGDYFPQMRFGKHVVTTFEDIKVPTLKEVTTTTGATVPVKSSVDGKLVRFTIDGTVRGSKAALERAVDEYVTGHHMKSLRVSERWTERGTNNVVKKGEQETGKTYDFTYEVALQNQGVFFFESKREAEQFRKANKDSHPSERLDRKTDLFTNSVLEGSNLSNLHKRIDNNTDLTAYEKGRLKQTLTEALVSSLPGSHSPSTFVQRRNVSGSSNDLARASTVYGRAHGNMMANLELGPELGEAMAGMQQLSALRVTNQRVRQQVVTELEKRGKILQDADPVADWAHAIAQTSALSKLFSPAHWIINGTQTTMNTWPELAGRFGAIKTTMAMTSVAVRMGIPSTLLRGVWNTAKATAAFNASHIDMGDPVGEMNKKLGSKYDGLFAHMVATGALDEGSGYEVARVTMDRPGVVRNLLASIDRISRQIPNAVEQVNRGQTGAAAYDLARADGMSEVDAIQYATDYVMSTQFDYRTFNTPRFMMGSKLGWAFQFKKYAVNQAWAYVDGFQTVLGTSATPKERAAAAAVLAARFGVQTLVAGITTNFGSELLKIFATALGFIDGDEDKWDMWKGTINQAIIEGAKAVAGKDAGEWWGELITQGVIAKVTGIDVSTRMSLEDMMSGFGPDSLDSQGIAAYLFSLSSGAPGQMLVGYADALKDLRDGKIDDALAKAAPIKFVADLFKAKSKFESGDYDAGQAILQTIGFRSSKEKESFETKASQWAPYNKAKQEKADLYDAYNNSKSAGERAAIMSQIREFNRSKKPKLVKDINVKTLEKYRREREREQRTGNIEGLELE